MKKLYIFILAMLCGFTANAANKYDNPDTLFVARDGTGQFRTISEAIEVCRAFMEYHKVSMSRMEFTKKSSSYRHGSLT